MRTIDCINSSNLESAEYDEAASCLLIQFKGGKKYRYKDVTPAVVDNFCAAESKGKFFSGSIRGAFQHEVVEEEKAAPSNPANPGDWPFPKSTQGDTHG